jgi:hypothetical protein
MCCFSREIDSVHNTRIFARSHSDGRQFIIYSMSISAKEDIAMVLPIPVVPGSGEKAVQFIALDAYPTIFNDMAKGFPAPVYRSRGNDPFAAAAAVPKPKLEVQRVGAYDASFVPTVADFSRLDERFRLPDGTWEKLPGYKGFGFAVFKLCKGTHNVHPMAFSFPSANPDRLFFPTLHIHDGKVHEKAQFDHTLYCQGAGLKTGEWQESPGIANQFMTTNKTQGIILGAQHLYKRTLSGMLTNTDWLVKARAIV